MWVQREILTVLSTSIAVGPTVSEKYRVTTSLFGISLSREEWWRETLLGYALLITRSFGLSKQGPFIANC